MRRRISIISNIDWFTVALYLILVILGWVNIYAAVYNEEQSSILDISQRYGKQFIWICAGFIMAFMIMLIDSKFFPYFAYPLYGLFMLLLVSVLFIGTEVHGARSWLAIGGFRLQPSEFAKFATALALSKYLSRLSVDMSKLKHIVYAFLIITFPALLIILQPDFGSALVYASFLLVLFRQGLPRNLLVILVLLPGIFMASLMFEKINIIYGLSFITLLSYYVLGKNKKDIYVALLVLGFMASIVILIYNFISNIDLSLYYLVLGAVFVASVIFLLGALYHRKRNILIVLAFFIGAIGYLHSVDYVYNNLLKKHQQTRIEIMLGQRSDPQGVGYNVNQSKIAIGSGGLTGKGFLRGTQTKYNFVPEQSTDFIFCTVGEEWGFIGTTIVVLLFLTLMLRIIYISERQRSNFARIYGYGVLSVLFFHFAVNVGMTIGLFPVIGIPLPFFSYGGSSLWSFTILLFILLNLDTRRMALMA